MPFALAALCAVAAAPLPAQDPVERYSDAFEAQFDPSQPVVRYTVRVGDRDRGGYEVEMRVQNAGDTLRLALPIWAPGAYRVVNFAQYVRDLTIEAGGQRVTVRHDAGSSTWQAMVGNGEATVRYRIAYPTPAAGTTPNNRSFVRESGALLDGPATYLYMVGQKLAPAHVRFEIPAGWRIATGLVPTADPRTFFAPSYDVLIDAPVLMGALRIWSFDVDGVPHRIAYWPLPDATPFDTASFVEAARQIVVASRGIAGRLPYREYTFLFIDGTGGGLEHLNSTTIGASSAALARDPLARIGVTAHEFFHSWNVKRIRPAVLGPFAYQQPVRTTGLWFSEGVTDYYAEVILRRADFLDEEGARRGLAGSIESYLGNPAHDRISPERSSWTAWDPPTVNGGYSISYYLQGALLGELLDLRIRQATAMRRGMDDVMRVMFERYAAARGFTGDDLLHVVGEVCACDLQLFFARHVSGTEPIDFDRELAPLGWRTLVHRATATDSAGRPRPDLRVSVISFGGIGSAGGAAGGRGKLSIPDPTGAWGKAGLATGDELISVNGRPASTTAQLRAALGAAAIGDTVRVEFLRGTERRTAQVTLAPYEDVSVSLVDVAELSPEQRAMRRYWMSGVVVDR